MDLTESRRIQTAGPAQPVLVYSPHPMDPARGRELIHAVFNPGETIAQYLVRTGLALRLGRGPVVCTIDGRRMPRELWTGCRPKPGTLINLYAVVRGGSGGQKKNPIAIVLTIVVMIYAPYLAPMLLPAGASAMAIAFTAFAITQVAGMVINAIFPPPKPNLSQAQGLAGGVTESPTYSLAGGSNRMRPFQPLPKFCGVHRVFPDLGARPFNEFEGEDQYLYMIFDFGYNDLVLSDYRIGATPIANYQGVTLEESGGDGKLALFPGNVDSQAGAALSAAAGWIQRTSSLNATALAIEIAGQQYAVADNGTIGALTRTIEAEYRLVGAAPWVAFWQGASAIDITSARRAPVRLAMKIAVAEGQYELRVRRTSADEVSDRLISDLAWSQLRTYQPDTADYAGRKRVALKIKASGQVNGTLEAFSAVASARCETWNGAAWVSAETSNPAWWVLDVARGKRQGDRRVWGGLIQDARIDLENLKAFAAWCTAMNLTFDGVFDQQMSVFDMLNAIALCGRGTVSRGGGRLEVVWDAPDQPVVAVFSMSNIKRDTFEIAYQTGDLADEIVLSFINPDLDWQRDTVRQLVAGVTEPVRSRSVELMGCIVKSMAGEAVNLYAAQQVLRTKTYKWQTDWEGQPASRGNVVKLSHDLASPDYSGRLIEGSSANALKLSRKVPLAAAGGFITLVRPDQSFATYDVAGGAGDSDTLALIAPLGFDPGADAAHPVYDYKWLYGHTSTPGKKVKISGWAPKGHDTVEITAIDELPEFYAAAANAYQYSAPLPVFGNPEISDLQLTEDGVRAGNGYLVKLFATWTTGADYSFAEVRASVNGGPLELRGETRERSFAFTVPDLGPVVVEVTGYSSLARLGRSVKLSAAKTVNLAGQVPPGDVTGFSGTIESLFIELRWNANSDIDLDQYEVRLGATWAAATQIYFGKATSYRIQPKVPGAYEFLVKAINTSGFYSANAASVSVIVDAVTPPTDLVLSDAPLVLEDGTVVPRIAASWTPSGDPFTIGWEVWFKIAGAPQWQTQTVTDPAAILQPLAVGGAYEIKIYTLTQNGRSPQALEASGHVALGQVTAPPPATALSATGGMFAVGLAWTLNVGARRDIRHTEVWASLTNNRATAARISAEPWPAETYVHIGLSPGQTWYYWVRLEDTSGNHSTYYPAGAAAGVSGAPSTNPSALLTQLFNSLGVAQLAAELAEPIAALPGDLVDLGNTAIALATDNFNNQTAIWDERTVRSEVDEAVVVDVHTIGARLDTGDYAAVKTESSVSVTRLNGIEAKWAVKVDVNGHVTAIELIGDGTTSSFIVLADQFLIVKPDGSGTPIPMLALGQVNGVTELGLDGNLIIDGTVVTRHIAADTITAESGILGDLSVTTLKVANGAITTSAFASENGFDRYFDPGGHLETTGTDDFASVTFSAQSGDLVVIEAFFLFETTIGLAPPSDGLDMVTLTPKITLSGDSSASVSLNPSLWRKLDENKNLGIEVKLAYVSGGTSCTAKLQIEHYNGICFMDAECEYSISNCILQAFTSRK